MDAVENGDWVLLDGIENAPLSIAKQIPLVFEEIFKKNRLFKYDDQNEKIYEYLKNEEFFDYLDFLLDEDKLNLLENNEKKINVNENFKLFITYNPEKKNNINFLPNSLIDKCMIYNLQSFENNKENISNKIYCLLLNLKLDLDKEMLNDISSILSEIYYIILKELNNTEISERTMINFFKSLNFQDKDIDFNFPSYIIQNFIYFYISSLDEKKKKK